MTITQQEHHAGRQVFTGILGPGGCGGDVRSLDQPASAFDGAFTFCGIRSRNEFMPNTIHVCFALAVQVGLPVVLVLALTSSLNLPDARTRLPNKEYWLSRERRGETVEHLRRQSIRFALSSALSLSYARRPWRATRLVVRMDGWRHCRVCALGFLLDMALEATLQKDSPN